MVPCNRHFSIWNRLRRLVCCWAPVSHALILDEASGDVSLQVETYTEEESSFLRLYLKAERPIDSFVLHLLLDPDHGTIAGAPVIEKPLRYGFSVAQSHVESAHSLKRRTRPLHPPSSSDTVPR